jgi:hypothetical protein
MEGEAQPSLHVGGPEECGRSTYVKMKKRNPITKDRFFV